MALRPTRFIDDVPAVEEGFVAVTDAAAVTDVDRELVAATAEDNDEAVAAAAAAANAAVDDAVAVGGILLEAGFKAVMEAFWLLLVEALRWLADCEVMTEVEAAAAAAAIP